MCSVIILTDELFNHLVFPYILHFLAIFEKVHSKSE